MRTEGFQRTSEKKLGMNSLGGCRAMAVSLQHTKTSGKDELFSRDRDHWSYSNLAQKLQNTLKLSVNMVYDIPRSPAKFQRDRTSAANFPNS